MCRKLLYGEVIQHSNMPRGCRVNVLPSYVLSPRTPTRPFVIRKQKQSVQCLLEPPHSLPGRLQVSFLLLPFPHQVLEQELTAELKCQSAELYLLWCWHISDQFLKGGENVSNIQDPFTWHSWCCLQDVSANMLSRPRLCAPGRSWRGWGASRERGNFLEGRQRKSEEAQWAPLISAAGALQLGTFWVLLVEITEVKKRAIPSHTSGLC